MTFKEQTEGEKYMNEMLTERAERFKKKQKTEAEKGGSSSQSMGREILNITNTWYSLG